jgi:hypothetical protein
MDVVQIDLSGSLGIDGLRQLLAEADVIIAVDAATQREFTVFGSPSLESTVSLKKPTAMRTVRVTINCRSGELEKLLESVRAVKGRDDYEGAGE